MNLEDGPIKSPQMKVYNYPDGSSLGIGTDSLHGFREFLTLLGIPVLKVEMQATTYTRPICITHSCAIGFVAYHIGKFEVSENGWSCALANKPESMASREAHRLMAGLQAHGQSTVEMGEAE